MPGLANHIYNAEIMTPSEQISEAFSEDYVSYCVPSGSSEYDTSNSQSKGESMNMAFNNFKFKLTTQQQMEHKRIPRYLYRHALEHSTLSDSHVHKPGRADADCMPNTTNNVIVNGNTSSTETEHSDLTFPHGNDPPVQTYSVSSESLISAPDISAPDITPCTEHNAKSSYKQSLLFSESQNVIDVTLGHKQGKRYVEQIRQRHRRFPLRPPPIRVVEMPNAELPIQQQHVSGTNADARSVTFNQTTNGSHTIIAPQTSSRRQAGLFGVHESDLSVYHRSALGIQDIDGDTYLMILLITDDVAKAEEVIKDYATNPNLLANQNAQGLTALMISVIKNQQNIVKSIVSLGVSLDTRDNENNTALHHACKLGNTRCAKYIVTAMKKFSKKNPNLKAIPTWKNTNGDDCLALAVNNSRLGILDVLVDQCGIGINTQEGTTGNTPLHTTVENQDINLVNHLLGYYSSEVQVDKPRYDGCTALQLIHHKDGPLYVHIKSLLLEAGAKTGHFARRDDQIQNKFNELHSDVRISGSTIRLDSVPDHFVARSLNGMSGA